MACPSGKIPHADREAALLHQKGLVYRNHLAGQSARSKGLNPYPCPECPAWHVGHTDERVPLVYHYTVGVRFDRILQSGSLRPRRTDAPSAAIDEPNPLLWFSWNDQWEYSVMKTVADVPPWRAYTELCGEGLYRWGAPASVAKLRWNDYLARNATCLVQREMMSQYGNPAEWLCTDQRVQLSECCSVEAYYRGRWTADVSDEDFAAYLDERDAVYDAAQDRLYAKVKHLRGDTILLAVKALIAKTVRLPKDAMLKVHADAIPIITALDRSPVEDDAEAILLEDYRLSVRRIGWVVSNWDAILKWQTERKRTPLVRKKKRA